MMQQCGRLSVGVLHGQGTEIREPRGGLRLWIGLQLASDESASQDGSRAAFLGITGHIADDDHVVTRAEVQAIGCAYIAPLQAAHQQSAHPWLAVYQIA